MDNRATDKLVQLYRTWGAGGTALLFTGNIMVDLRALGESGNVVIEDDRDMDTLKAWVAAGKENGAEIWVQLNHLGRQCPKGLNMKILLPVSPRQQEFAVKRVLAACKFMLPMDIWLVSSFTHILINVQINGAEVPRIADCGRAKKNKDGVTV
jgi:2,4-dienoyl-CoA reductase-like NADH-dependent reductase (Old Yellow Enzyme family)